MIVVSAGKVGFLSRGITTTVLKPSGAQPSFTEHFHCSNRQDFVEEFQSTLSTASSET